MTSEIIHLSEQHPEATLTTFIAETPEEMPFNKKRKAVLICPGGAYCYCSSREGEAIALYYLARGFNAFVLRYTTRREGGKYPIQLIQASQCMQLIRNNAERFHVDPEKVFVVGFSAGGHLAASLGTMWHKKFIREELGIEYGVNKPTGMVLGYPVITSGKYAHRGSIDALANLPSATDPDYLNEVSLEKQVSKKTVPAFVWHTFTDTTVPVMNSLLLTEAMAKKKVPFELHVYPYGGHGQSLCNPIVGSNLSYCEGWIEQSVKWMNLFE